ncbi:MAG: SPFH domain-containing protein [Nannocystis sp.]|nr:SPFH domain-containing protein [Nannocystis sp.]MBA3548204.1 SPFH domain-containing protein [Nannocystis sp.]
MSTIKRISQFICIAALTLLIAPTCFISTVPLGYIGVRSSNFSGVNETDLEPGWNLNVASVHNITLLPSRYLFLDYGSDNSQGLQIRTRDNNNVFVDITVPYRIKPGEAHLIMKVGNHLMTNGTFGFQRQAADVTVSVLREDLANLTSSDFYNTDKRLAVATTTLDVLNKTLAPLHLEAQAVLVRAVTFRPEYEVQLQAIQLNEQNKLLDGARQRVAQQQQELDNFELKTTALANALQQDWVKKQADLERAYQVGFLFDPDADRTPGAARRQFAALTEADLDKLREEAARVLEIDDKAKINEAYLLGIQNISAETLEYKQRVTAEANGISGRLKAEGEADVAAVRGEFETKINALLGSPAGRAYVAWKTAENVTFSPTLTFQSREGVPSVLRLRNFALQFMGGG